MKKVFLIGFVYYALLLAGCATTTGTAPDDSLAVESRANERINLIIAGEVLKAYEYLSPGYRSSVSPESYIAEMVTRKLSWTHAELLESECTENHCTVSFKIDYTVPSPVPGVRKFEFFDNFDEDWIFTQRQWWFVPKN